MDTNELLRKVRKIEIKTKGLPANTTRPSRAGV